MKRLLLILALVLTSSIFAVGRSYQIEAVSARVLQNQSWTEWSSFKATDLTLTMSSSNIKVDSKTPQFYTIRIDTYAKTFDQDYFIYESWGAVDINGLNLKVTLISKNNILYFLLISYSDAEWIYEIEK